MGDPSVVFFGGHSVMAGTEALSPSSLVPPRTQQIYVAARGEPCLCLDVASEKVEWSAVLSNAPWGLALSADGQRLFVVGAATRAKCGRWI